MSAVDIIAQIRRLPDDEQDKVKRIVKLNLEPGQLSGEELGALTKKMIETNDAAEAGRLKEEIIRGFYGDAGPEN
jgi:hypothetical protein